MACQATKIRLGAGRAGGALVKRPAWWVWIGFRLTVDGECRPGTIAAGVPSAQNCGCAGRVAVPGLDREGSVVVVSRLKNRGKVS